jgi:cell division protein FtsL
MLDTRIPSSSLSPTLPRRSAATQSRRRSSGAASAFSTTAYVRPDRTIPRPPTSRPTARRTVAQSRMARSEARMLALAVAVTTLMCGVLVIYLAAYAHVTWLGMEQAQAREQLTLAIRENHRLQMNLADLKDPAHIIAAAKAQGMTLYTERPAYVIVGANGQASVLAGR